MIRPITQILIFETGSDKGMLLVLNGEHTNIYQWPLVFWQDLRFPDFRFTTERGVPIGGYWSLEKPGDAWSGELTFIAKRQFDYSYQMIRKNDLLQLLDNILPDVPVRINTFGLWDQSYVRKQPVPEDTPSP